MAEALCRTRCGDSIEARSAGVDPWDDLHPMARKLMAERGETLAGHYPKHVNTMSSEAFDLVVTIGDRAQMECPAMSGNPRRVHWALSDPAEAEVDDAHGLEQVFRRTLSDIEHHLASLV